KFEGSSYGFRPGRSCHDAIGKIYRLARPNMRKKWVLDAAHLNSVIRGWANYFRSSVASASFKKLDDWMYKRQWRYVKRTHKEKPSKWCVERYWGQLNPQRDDHWVFGDKQTGNYLLKFAWFPIRRHIMVKGKASPDDSDLKEYWADR